MLAFYMGNIGLKQRSSISGENTFFSKYLKGPHLKKSVIMVEVTVKRVEDTFVEFFCLFITYS